MGEILHQIGIRGPVLLMQLVGFLIMLVILKTLLFDRVLAFVAAREEEVERRRQESAALEKARAEAEARLAARRAEIEKEAYERTQAEVRAGLKRKADILQEAHDRAQAEIERARAEVAAEREAARARLESDAVELAIFVAARGLRKPRLIGAKYEEIAKRAISGGAA